MSATDLRGAEDLRAQAAWDARTHISISFERPAYVEGWLRGHERARAGRPDLMRDLEDRTRHGFWAAFVIFVSGLIVGAIVRGWF